VLDKIREKYVDAVHNCNIIKYHALKLQYSKLNYFINFFYVLINYFILFYMLIA
jgi:hypothetical protein